MVIGLEGNRVIGGNGDRVIGWNGNRVIKGPITLAQILILNIITLQKLILAYKQKIATL